MTERPPSDAPEHVKAQYWRKRVLRVTQDELSRLTGYSVSSVRAFERGCKNDPRRTPLDPDAIKRYRTACAAIEARVRFDWLTCQVGEAKPREL